MVVLRLPVRLHRTTRQTYLAVGCWLLVVGCWLLAAGCWLLWVLLLVDGGGVVE